MPHSRALIAQRVAAGQAPPAVARAAEGPLALDDRCCHPHSSPRAISAAVMHGLGVASALRDLAVPPGSLAWALFDFNGGEAGQAVALAGVGLVWFVTRLLGA